jgi:hypothetical protein
MDTAEASCMAPKSVWVRWTIDHVKEWVRDNLPSLMSHRIDPDYNAEDENDREVMRILRQLIARPSGNNYHEGGGEKRTLNWILGVLSVLLVGAVGGGISVYGKVSSLETRVSEWQRSAERESNEMRRRLDRLENPR